jgi:predicted  nucleic acid-binding Zn-ribbon protein
MCAQVADAEARLGAQQVAYDAARAEASRNRQNLLAAQDELAQLRTRIRGLVRLLPDQAPPCVAPLLAS